MVGGFIPFHLEQLPFPTIVVASTNDHVVDYERAEFFADIWGSELVTIEAGEHLEKNIGTNDWADGITLLEKINPNDLEQRAYLFYGSLGEYFIKKEDYNNAITNIDKAIDLVKNESEKEYLIKENQIKITNPINLKLEEVKIINATSKQNIFVDKEKLEFPLKLRKWKNGDFFFPKGMQGKKKLSKYFKDEKFSLLDKQNTWLLCNNNNDILWVIGYRQDNRFIISENTKKFIKISI